MILRQNAIKAGVATGDIIITPYDADMVGPNSVDVHLDSRALIVLPNANLYGVDCIDPYSEQKTAELIIEDGYLLEPGQLLLCSTVEAIGSTKYVPMLEGRSSIGRMGLFVHITAGFGDVGFVSKWTVELTCVLPIIIYPMMRIAQVFFHTCEGSGDLYHGHYIDQSQGPVGSRYNE